MAVGRLASLKTSSLIGINTNVSLYFSSDSLSDVTITIANQGLEQAQYFIGISSGSLSLSKDSDYIVFNKPLDRNESVSVNVGVKSGDLIFCKASKEDVSFLAFSTFDYQSGISSYYGRETSIKISDSQNEPNTNISILNSTRKTKATLVIENNSFDSAFVSAGISSGGVSGFKSSDYLFYAKKLAPRQSYTFDNIGIGINQSLIVRSSKTNVRFVVFSTPANPDEGLIVSTLSGDGGISTTGGDLYIGGDLYVKDDLVLDELTARNATFTKNLNVTGVSTFSSLLDANNGLEVTGGSTLDNLNITGLSTFAGIMTVTGPTLFAGQLNISGIVTANKFVGDGSQLTNVLGSRWNITAAGIHTLSNVGIGTTNPTEKLTVRNGDISVGIDTSYGLILTSPNATKYRLIVANDGTLSTTLVS